MKFSVSSSALLSLLATTGKVISNKNTLPILDYFLMELSGTTLKVTTSDLETTLVGSIEVDSVETEGTIAAPAKLMLDSLKEFPELPLEIDVNDKNWEIRINWKSGSLSIPGASAVSYPAVPQLSAEKEGDRARRRYTGERHQQDHLRHGRRRVASGDERHLHQPATRVVDVRGNRRAQAREVRVRDAERGLLVVHPAQEAGQPAQVGAAQGGGSHRRGLRFEERHVQPQEPYARVPPDRRQLPELQRRDSDGQPQQGAGGPHRAGERHQARGRLLESHDEPDPHGDRRQPHQPRGAGHRLLGVGQRDHIVQLRRTADRNRLQIDLPGRDPLEHGHADGGRRTGRFDACGRLQAGL